MILVRYWIFSELKVLGRASLQVWYSMPNLPRKNGFKSVSFAVQVAYPEVVGILEFSSSSISSKLFDELINLADPEFNCNDCCHQFFVSRRRHSATIGSFKDKSKCA